MITYYCPHCWAELEAKQSTCPVCGYVVEEFNSLSFEDKLIAALHHVVPERRIMAAQILGNIHSQRAISEFERILESGEDNYYLLRAVLLGLVKIDHPKRKLLLEKAREHPSVLVADLARELLDDLSNQQSPDRWDKHTG